MKMNVKRLLICLASVLTWSAHAQQTAGVRMLAGLGVTLGGDQIGKTVAYSNGPSTTLHAGGTVDLRGGIAYQLQGQPVALELSIGYHFDKANAENGDVSFTRFPLELIAHYALDDTWRVGLGARKSLSAKVSSSGVGVYYAQDAKYTGEVSPLVEVEYFMSPQFSFKGRYVSERFTPDSGGKKLDGSHGGIYGMFYF
jgi:hypothetical protein